MFEVLREDELSKMQDTPVSVSSVDVYVIALEYQKMTAQAQLKQDMEDVIKLIDELDNGMRSSGSWRTKIRELRQELKEKVK